MGRSQPSMTCCRARGKVTAVGDRKKTGWAAFRVGIPILGTMFSPGELRPEPPTEAALLRQLAVDQGGGRVQGQDHSHQQLRPKNDSGHRDPKQPSKRFHPGLCPSQRGPEFAGEGAEIQQQSQAERQPRGGVMPLNRAFGAWPWGPPRAAGRGTRSGLAH